MARSHYIYYFRNKWTGCILAAFTVKHEAISFSEGAGFGPDDVELYRIRDGGRGEPELMEEFNSKGVK